MAASNACAAGFYCPAVSSDKQQVMCPPGYFCLPGQGGGHDERVHGGFLLGGRRVDKRVHKLPRRRLLPRDGGRADAVPSWHGGRVEWADGRRRLHRVRGGDLLPARLERAAAVRRRVLVLGRRRARRL
jgi:hypothetical protein